MTITGLLAQLQRDEGLRLHAYKDSVGVLTIGYGHNLEAHGITEAVASAILAEDIDRARADVLTRIPVSMALDEIRRDALINMAFNLGIVGLLRFTALLGALEQQDWPAAAQAMLDSKWARQVGERAHRLADQMRDGSYH